MGKDIIKILGDWAAWADPVRQGRLERPDGESVWVLVRCRADLRVDDDGWKTLKAHGRLMSRIDHPSVLRLLHTTKIKGQPAWVYEGFQAVSLARALDVANAGKEFVPARVAVEAVERTVQGIRAALSQGASIPGAPGPVLHLGPAPSEVLVDAVGGVRVAGFSLASAGVVDARPPTGYAPHVPGTPEQRAAYGVGALLVHLLGGDRPAEAAAEASRQEAVIRRAVIRVLARPGEAVPDSMPDLIRSCLAHDPEERPALTAIQDELSASAETLRSAGLRTWCPANVPQLLLQAEQGYPDPDTARMKRHIEPMDDHTGRSFVPTQKTQRPPREIATIVGRHPMPVRSPPPSEDAISERTPLISATTLDSIPTSETDVYSLQRPAPSQEPAQPEPPDPVRPEDTWEDDGAARMGGWPLVAGALIGMVVAAVVGVFAVNHMTGTVTNEAPSATEAVRVSVPTDAALGAELIEDDSKPVPAAPAEGSEGQAATEDAVESAPAIEPDTEPTDAVTPEAESTPVSEAKEASTSDESDRASGQDAAEASSAASSVPAVSTAATAAQTAAGEDEGFAVTFMADPETEVDRMLVRCHKIDPVEGVDEVHIARAVRGPCRVEGFIGQQHLSVSAILKGPKNYTCFRGGARICE